MNHKSMKLKFLLFGGMALALAGCADDSLKEGNDNNQVVDDNSPLNTATVLAGQWGQSRVSNVAPWSIMKTRDAESWVDGIDFTIPSNAIDISTSQSYNQNDVLVVPEGKDVTIQLNDNFKGKLYIAGNYHPQKLGPNSNNLEIYVLESGELTFKEIGISNNGKLYNAGTVNCLTGLDGSKITEIYNLGELNFGSENTWHNLSNSVSIFSEGGSITFTGQGVSFMASADINSVVYFDVNQLTFQNSSTQKFCGIVFDGKIQVPDDNLHVRYIKAKELEMNGHLIHLLDNAFVDVETLRMTTNANNDRFKGTDGTSAIIKAKDIYFGNGTGFEVSFSSNIKFQITGNIYDSHNGSRSWTVSQYLASEAGDNLKERFTFEEIDYSPSCGIEVEPEPTPEPEGPKLELVASVQSPTHNHNDGKDNRHLSATSIDWDGSTIYVSYHMRGDEDHYAGDVYDKDGIEGCIETWTIDYNPTDNSSEVGLGRYMWTNDFDFNHLIIDGDNIITVGHMEKKGAIIARIQNNFNNFELVDEDQNTYSTELKYKVLTTDEKLYGDFVNEDSGNATNQFIDYEDAGDGNCLIKVGEEYFVATYKGYGRVDAATLKSVKDTDKKPQFVSTDGSAKFIIENNGEIAVLYLNKRGNNTAEFESPATLATFTTSGFPFTPTSVSPLADLVKPVDGKNVLAHYGNNYFACLSKGGLNVGNGTSFNQYKFGEEDQEPVNGIDIDDDYIYLASGSHLRVLDHNMEKVASYHLPKMSCNFVKVVTTRDGKKYIIAAYGQKGLKVFELKNV